MKKKNNLIYYALGAAAIWYLYKKYYKPTAPVTDTPIILFISFFVKDIIYTKDSMTSPS